MSVIFSRVKSLCRRCKNSSCHVGDQTWQHGCDALGIEFHNISCLDFDCSRADSGISSEFSAHIQEDDLVLFAFSANFTTPVGT